MAGAGAILKRPDIAGSLSGLRNAFKGISSSNWFTGLAGGLATFFSFEWLTSGGLVDSVSGTFGISEMGGTIRPMLEILKLTPGSLLELDKEEGAPIDLKVNGHLIARGEVVELDGCYAVRITELVYS